MAASLIGRRILLNKNNICKIPRRNGYIVLLPEIGEDLPEKNPLLKEETKLPEFNKFTIEKCIAAIAKQTIEVEQGIQNLEEKIKGMKDEEIFDKLLNPLEELSLPLEISWGIAKTLYLGSQTLMPTKLFTNIKNRAYRGILAKYQSEVFYEACEKAYENDDLNLTQEERQVLFKFILEGQLRGLKLKNKTELDYYTNELHKEQSLYRMKFEHGQKRYRTRISDPNIVRDFPENLLATLAQDPSQPQQGPWTLTYNTPIISQFLEYCPDPCLRFKAWEDQVKLCSMQEDRAVQTSQNIEGIRLNRNRMAETLGFKNYAEFSMETKMAGHLDNVYNVFETLYETARPSQDEEIKNLTKFAYDRGFDGKLNEWDIPYWSRKQLRSVYGYDKEASREYFPFSKVLQGLFDICEELFNIKIVEEKKCDIWHKDVRFFNVFDLSESSTKPVSGFYLDPFSRSEHKRMIPGSVSTIKYKSAITADTPLLAIIFNFQPPTAEKESLLTFKDVSDLFNKFGYALRSLLIKNKYHIVTDPVEWDAYGITAHFLENRLYESSTIKRISQHYKTGEPLSDELVNNFKNIRTNMAGYNLCKEMYLSELDLQLHSNKDYWMPISERLWKKYFGFPMHKSNEHICTFSQIFVDTWGGAYYSSLWSEMCAADAYSCFHEISEQDENQVRKIGKRFRETFLTYGGSYPASEVFRQFRGRDPSPLALLKTLNLKMPEPQVNKAKVEANLKPDLIE